MSLLEVRGVTAGYGEVQILWGADLALEEGKLTALVGSNGAGKTTLLRAVMGLLKPRQGQVLYGDRDVTRLPAYRKAELGLALVPEGRQLFTDMTVLENLEMGATPQRARAQVQRNLDRVFGTFPRLKERQQQKAGTLSGGEQQMVAMARALMGRPKLICMDEPTMGLSPLFVDRVLELIATVNRTGVSVFMVEQNASMALRIADYGYVLQTGRIVLEGPAKELLADPRIRSAYLGENVA